MEEPLKKRLLGAAVLTALGVLFIPMLLEPPPRVDVPALREIPERPGVERFESSILREEVPVRPPLPPLPPKPVEVVLPDPEPPAPQPEIRKPVSQPAPTRPAAKEPLVQPGPKTQPAPVVTASAPRAWVVQVGSFTSRDNARKLAGKLRKAGFQVLDPGEVTIAGKRHYRVQVGPMADKTRAAGMVKRIASIAGTSPKVVSYP